MSKTIFYLSLHYNGANSWFVNDTEIFKLKAKDSEIVASPLCLGNISKNWLADYMRKTGFNGYIYDFSADYDAVAVDDIKDIHRYLMKKNNIVWYVCVWKKLVARRRIIKCLDLLKKCF